MLDGENAPITMGGNITSAIPGTPAVTVPVNVEGFSNIGQFTLTLKFDTTRVYFVSAAPNPELPELNVIYTSPSGNTLGKLVLSWTGSSNVSLADGSSLVDLTFHYITGTGQLAWAYLYGSICQYKRYDGGNLVALDDNPKYYHYRNGGISNRSAPVTFAPLITMTVPGPVQLPVTVSNFTGIGAMTLYLEYDPAVIAYQNSYVKNPVFGSTFSVGNIPATGGKMQIVMQWYGSALSLANGAVLCTFNFNYLAGNNSCALSWFDNGPSCEYADGAGDILIDLPEAGYYHDGYTGPPLISDFIADNLAPLKNETVQFTDLSTGGATGWNWSFDRPDVVFLNGTTSLSQNPQVAFTDGGLYTVTLLVSNAYLSDSEVKPGYVRAGQHGLWTGNNSAAWNTLTNWDDHLVPDSNTPVIIPPAAINWPVYDGDFTLGIQCSNLTLSGTTSLMTITGNLTLP